MSTFKYITCMTVLAGVVWSDNATDTCSLPWETVLEEWVTSDSVTNSSRHGRIMSLPPSQGYYVSDRIDLVPPPPPPHHMHRRPPHMNHRGPYPAAPIHPPGSSGSHPPGPHGPNPNGSHPPGPPGPNPNGSYPPGPPNSYPNGLHPPGPPPSNPNGAPPPGPPPSYPGGSHPPGPPPGGPHPPPFSPSPTSYDEWEATPPPSPGAGKIVNRPPNPYKDQFKPSYAPPTPIPVDRVDAAAPPAPHKQVSETDVYLLRAIEKLVYRVDLMEKRLRKMEENMHYIVAGAEPKPEPCSSNYTRVGAGCYHVSSEAANWKGASYACRRLKGNLLELDDEERKSFVHGLLTDKNLKGSDFWTGGLNPGLLWIWSHSAKPVANNSSSSADIAGEGRCLALVHAGGAYQYRGHDCALRHRYVCEALEDKQKLGNEIERVARTLREGRRKPKIMWNDDDN